MSAVMFKLCKVCREEKPGKSFYENEAGYSKSTCTICDERKARFRVFRKRLGGHVGGSEETGCMTYVEVGKALGLPAWAVEKIERKALVKLRRMMGGWAL
jgi:hypothetical protein